MLSSFLNFIAWLLDNWWVFHVLVVLGAAVWLVAGGSLRKVIKFLLYATTFSVLVVMTSSFFPFIGGKDFFFRTTIQLGLIFYLLWWGFEAKAGEAVARFREVARKPLFIAVSAFMLTFLFASIFAHDPNAAFWSNYERGEGGFQMLHYYAFFALLVLFFDKKDDWIKLFRISVLVSFLLIAYGVFANLGLAPKFISTYPQAPPEGFWKRLTQGRFHGSLGNPAYVAPYLIFSMFYLASLWNWSNISGRLKGLKKLAIYGGIFSLFSFFFLLSQTRAGIIGLGVAVFVFLIYLVAASPHWRKLLSVVLIILILASGVVLRYKDSQLIHSLPFWKIFNISLSVSGLWTLNTRFWTWGSAWQGFLDRPILGWGPENFTAVFDKYFDPRHHVPDQNTETWFDRAHSIYFDYLAETGILGLAAYLSIFAVILSGFSGKFLIFWRKRLETEPSGKSVIQEALIFSLAVGYLVQGLAIFDVLPMYINLFLFFAFSFYYLYYVKSPNGDRTANSININKNG